MNDTAAGAAGSRPGPSPPIATLEDIRALERTPYDEAVPVTDMYGLFRRSAELWRERPAITWMETGAPDTPATVTTYADLLAGVTQAANLYRGLGVGEGDSVALLVPNMPQAHLALWGAETAGRACPINNLLNPDHIVHLIRAAGAKVLVALGPDLRPETGSGPELGIMARALEVRDRCPELAAVLLIEADGAADPAQRTYDFEAMLADQPADRLTFDRALGRDTPAACFHTGGTTGAPKLAQHRHGNQVHTSWSGAVMYGLGPGDVMLNGFPLFHVAGSFVYGASAFISGGSLLLPTRAGMRNPDVIANYWRHVERFGVTQLAAVPTVLAGVLNVPIGDSDISSVRTAWTGGTPLPTELAAAFERGTGLPVRNIFGMTESAGLVAIAPAHGERKPGGVGLRLPYTEVKAVRLTPDGPDLSADCAPGESGVMVLRGPHVGPGYTDPARNAGMFTDDGWLISGDLGHVDEDGQIYLTGRSKDVIIRGAHNIDPSIIEEAAAEHPAVEMAAAVGQPDGYAGELPVVYVTLKPGETATGQDILDFLAPRIAERPALPKRAHVVDAMPVTAVGKIYKPALRLRSLERVYAEALAPLEEEEGLRIRVEGVDTGGSLSARLHIVAPGGDHDCRAAELAIAQRLRDFATPWDCVWE